MTSAGTGSSRPPAVEVVNHAPPTTAARMMELEIQQADAAVASATSKVAKQERHVAASDGDKEKRQRDHLKAAKEALAQATAARKELG